ncbi:uncharacterized protein TM35_000441700 [Trypanosoma theileri]|uniref:Mucin-associated surface protein (MASP) n=1 Tax=Trypanosoma theileri TaxID=67003 RepID=A0A1X0NIC6_9TRYP|nr:uncharacterized protein TM35_000441700 [Trypanosoma theileri]ORC84514.1 hypothetical protein TM35_000441700 [Trypanosoma theileri]
MFPHHSCMKCSKITPLLLLILSLFIAALAKPGGANRTPTLTESLEYKEEEDTPTLTESLEYKEEEDTPTLTESLEYNNNGSTQTLTESLEYNNNGSTQTLTQTVELNDDIPTMSTSISLSFNSSDFEEIEESNMWIIIAACVAVALVLIFIIFSVFICCRCKKRQIPTEVETNDSFNLYESEMWRSYSDPSIMREMGRGEERNILRGSIRLAEESDISDIYSDREKRLKALDSIRKHQMKDFDLAQAISLHLLHHKETADKEFGPFYEDSFSDLPEVYSYEERKKEKEEEGEKEKEKELQSPQWGYNSWAE